MKAQSIKSLLRLVSLTALLAGECGAAVISRDIPREDGIVFQSFGPENSRSIDVNNDGIEDFQFRAVMLEQFSIFPASGNRAAAVPVPTGPDFLPAWGATTASHAPGDLIGAAPAAGYFWWLNEEPIEFGATVPHEWSLFILADNPVPDLGLQHYVGLEFQAADGLHYGYMRLYRARRAAWYAELAWETEPGVAIQVPVPEPSAALLLLPCAALCLRRRRA